ncbi:arylformamidase [Noviherbaspirillum humi]|uniref:Arylformamidase n=1 Tax=Noviherbaspirillum humi TaxID=1688639 RepID=A0A239GPL2_9BURK|nr:alpha/beta hydrolase [Noviherbaspirillum humi]SNS71139.1 arylformamidase [Noviherbaspirillum humi]
MDNPTDFYSRQYNARASIPDHPHIFTRWLKESQRVRRNHAALLDLPYGDTPAERLDFFPARGGGAPLLVFIHGGWWRAMDKSDFSFIAPSFVAAGMNVAITNYTLAPTATLDEIVHEQLRALAWLYRHAEQYDFDPERIIVSGHSAGGHLTAMLMAALWPEVGADLPRDLVKAGVVMSGVADLEPLRHVDFLKDDLKLDDARIHRLSPATMPQSHPAPFVTAVGALESEEFHRQAELLAEHWKDNHRANLSLDGINHMTICDAFADPESPLFQATLDLVENTASSAGGVES